MGAMLCAEAFMEELDFFCRQQFIIAKGYSQLTGLLNAISHYEQERESSLVVDLLYPFHPRPYHRLLATLPVMTEWLHEFRPICEKPGKLVNEIVWFETLIYNLEP